MLIWQARQCQFCCMPLKAQILNHHRLCLPRCAHEFVIMFAECNGERPAADFSQNSFRLSSGSGRCKVQTPIVTWPGSLRMKTMIHTWISRLSSESGKKYAMRSRTPLSLWLITNNLWMFIRSRERSCFSARRLRTSFQVFQKMDSFFMRLDFLKVWFLIEQLRSEFIIVLSSLKTERNGLKRVKRPFISCLFMFSILNCVTYHLVVGDRLTILGDRLSMFCQWLSFWSWFEQINATFQNCWF
jgi:hypothetical protein